MPDGHGFTVDTNRGWSRVCYCFPAQSRSLSLLERSELVTPTFCHQHRVTREKDYKNGSDPSSCVQVPLLSEPMRKVVETEVHFQDHFWMLDKMIVTHLLLAAKQRILGTKNIEGKQQQKRIVPNPVLGLLLSGTVREATP